MVSCSTFYKSFVFGSEINYSFKEWIQLLAAVTMNGFDRVCYHITQSTLWSVTCCLILRKLVGGANVAVWVLNLSCCVKAVYYRMWGCSVYAKNPFWCMDNDFLDNFCVIQQVTRGVSIDRRQQQVICPSIGAALTYLAVHVSHLRNGLTHGFRLNSKGLSSSSYLCKEVVAPNFD